MTRLLNHTLLVTYLNDALAARHITVEHLADLLAPVSETVVRSWLEGSASPTPDDLLPLATALHLHPVEMVAGWIIDQSPDLEEMIRPLALDVVGSHFPRRTDLALRAPRPPADMDVGDPHDLPGALRFDSLDARPLRKRAAGARARSG